MWHMYYVLCLLFSSVFLETHAHTYKHEHGYHWGGDGLRDRSGRGSSEGARKGNARVFFLQWVYITFKIEKEKKYSAFENELQKCSSPF